MTHYNTNNDVVIKSEFRALDNKDGHLKDGEITPHSEIVTDLFFYANYGTSDNPTYTKVWLNKNFIIDIYNQIQDIEKNIVDAPYDNLPF